MHACMVSTLGQEGNPSRGTRDLSQKQVLSQKHQTPECTKNVSHVETNTSAHPTFLGAAPLPATLLANDIPHLSVLSYRIIQRGFFETDSLSIMLLNFIHIISFPFYFQMPFQCLHKPHFVYPFIC